MNLLFTWCITPCTPCITKCVQDVRIHLKQSFGNQSDQIWQRFGTLLNLEKSTLLTSI